MEDRKKRQTLTHALAVAFPRGGTKDMCQRWSRQTPSHNAVASAIQPPLGPYSEIESSPSY